jgi:hypothetical protein
MLAETLTQQLEARYAAGELEPGGMAEKLLLFGLWLEAGQCMIRDIHAQLVPLHPNAGQRTLYDAMVEQALNDQPIRIVVLKSRKIGVSTFIEAFMVFCCEHYDRTEARLMAHEHDATCEIAEIGKLIAKEYVLIPSVSVLQEIRFPLTKSKYLCHTAGGKGAGAGGTPNMLHLSEMALWGGDKEKSEYTAVNAVPWLADSMIAMESTARGRDFFWSRFDSARSGRSPYAAVFIPWFVNPDYRQHVDAYEEFGLTADETAIVALGKREYSTVVSIEQLAWRRAMLETMHPAIFKQEFPATPEEAVESRKGAVLPLLASCVVDKLDFDPRETPFHVRIGGMDYGFHDATVLISGFYIDQVLWITQVYHRAGGLAREHVMGLEHGHTYYCDPSATAGRFELIRESRDSSIDAHLIPAPRRKADRATDFVLAEWAAVHRMCVEGRLRILRPCSDRIIAEAGNLTWNETTGTPDMKRGDAWGHFDTLEALRYMVMGVSRVRADGNGAVAPRPPSRRELMRR